MRPKPGDLIKWTPTYKTKHVTKPYYLGIFIRWAPIVTWKSGDAFHVLCDGKFLCWGTVNAEVVSESG